VHGQVGPFVEFGQQRRDRAVTGTE
jgi:hypothetical protein